MTTSSLTLDEIYALAHEALLGSGANEEHADAECDDSNSQGLFRILSYAPLGVIVARLQKVGRLAGVHCRVVEVKFCHASTCLSSMPEL